MVSCALAAAQLTVKLREDQEPFGMIVLDRLTSCAVSSFVFVSVSSVSFPPFLFPFLDLATEQTIFVFCRAGLVLIFSF
jgi:hypothetical protein